MPATGGFSLPTILRVLAGKAPSSRQTLPHSHLWRRFQGGKDNCRIFVSTGRNYKVYADTGLDYFCMHCLVTILDTGARPNFIDKKKIQIGFNTKIYAGPLQNICNANRNRLWMLGTTNFRVYLDHKSVALKLIVWNTLAAFATVGASF